MPRRTILDHISQLDPEHDYEQIVFLSGAYEFPFDTKHALEFALFRTFAIPATSAVLQGTGEFQYRAQKRYDDTTLILSEIIEHGVDSARARLAFRQMNRMHRQFAIPNDAYLYVLSTFIYEPIRWNMRFGWRPLIQHERLAAFYFWREVGKRMGIRHIPNDIDTFERFNLDYEDTHFQYSDANRCIATATRDLFLGWFLPKPLWGLGESVVYALMDDPLLEAFGFPKPSPGMRRLVESTLRMRGRLVRHLPERAKPVLHTTKKHRTYPEGYRIEELGTLPEVR